MSDTSSQQAAPDEGAASPRPELLLLDLAQNLIAMASDVDADIQQARKDDDRERREYLRGERYGLLQSVNLLTAAAREAMR